MCSINKTVFGVHGTFSSYFLHCIWSHCIALQFLSFLQTESWTREYSYKYILYKETAKLWMQKKLCHFCFYYRWLSTTQCFMTQSIEHFNFNRIYFETEKDQEHNSWMVGFFVWRKQKKFICNCNVRFSALNHLSLCVVILCVRKYFWCRFFLLLLSLLKYFGGAFLCACCGFNINTILSEWYANTNMRQSKRVRTRKSEDLCFGFVLNTYIYNKSTKELHAIETEIQFLHTVFFLCSFFSSASLFFISFGLTLCDSSWIP